MSSKDRLQNQRPGVFKPSIVRDEGGSSETVRFISKQDLDAGISYDEYFVYDQEGTGIKSTQQIPVDFSKFQNHTFFNSAQANVNVAFNNLINHYPFDGSRQDLEKFLNGLSGFENYVLESFPTNLGSLVFSGSTTGASDSGTYIEVKDFSGAAFVDFSSDRSGKSVLALDEKSYTIEAQLFPAPLANGNEILFQKVSGSINGYTMAMKTNASTTAAEVMFAIRSGSNSLVVSGAVTKNQFNHVAAVYDRGMDDGRLKLYVDSKLVGTSSTTALFGPIDFNNSSLFIGSGSVHEGILHDSADFTPTRTLSASLDEIRIFQEARTKHQLESNQERNIFGSDPLRLYYKFNEPSASFGDNSIVLDSSGKSLHSKVTNYSVYNRVTSSYPRALSSEERKFNPVLFPQFGKVIDLNENLLASASTYDNQNPNLITRLIPAHYFDEGKNYFAMNSIDGDIILPYSGTSMPGSGDLGSSQILTAMMFVWAKFFDELKISTDQFSKVLDPAYTSDEGISDSFITFLINHYGFEPPPILTKASPQQYFHGENVKSTYTNIEESLQSIRNQILRRFLVNIRDIITSKGTVHSVKAALRATGLDPDILVRIKEYGGPKKFSFAQMRTTRATIQSTLDFSSSMSNRDNESIDAQGFTTASPYLVASFLTGSRKAVGFPDPTGAFVHANTVFGGYHGVCSDLSDGLFTSGSWTYEGLYRFPVSGSFLLSQSAARIHITGTTAPSTKHGVAANLLVMSGGDTSVKLFVRATTDAYTAAAKPPLEMILTGANVMDGGKWNISFGRTRNDESNALSSSYFLRCAKQEGGRIFESYTTSSYYKEDPTGTASKIVFQKAGSLNTSGSFIVIGSQSLDTSANIFLNGPDIDDQAQLTNFSGEIAQVRFWSKALTHEEWREHVRNPTSVGVEDPRKNFNFNTVITGAFQRLRMDLSIDQPISASDTSGQIILTDFSQNRMYGTGSAFETSKTVFNFEKVIYTSLPPAFDDLENSNKIRPRSFVSSSNITNYDAAKAPLFEIEPNDLPQDDPRFSIDFSVASALNEDIITMFGTLDEIDEAVGTANLQFSPDYPQLQVLRDNYFHKLEKKVSFKEFLEFFRWFDTSIGTMLEQLVPKKTNFLGVNFVIEPHSLERAKVQYQYNGQYIGEDFRTDLKGQYLLQLIEGRASKF